MLAITAMLAIIFGLVVQPAGTAPALVLAGALAFAGLRRMALTLLIVLTLLGAAGLRVDVSSRSLAPAPEVRR